jgi:hypothetical protein
MEALASVARRWGRSIRFCCLELRVRARRLSILEAMQRALDKGLSSILLVPEIGLTPQTVGLLDAAFGERVALLHSALTPEERSEQWRRIQRGEPRRLWWERARRSLRRRRIWAWFWWMKSTTRVTSRRRRRATTRAMWP